MANEDSLQELQDSIQQILEAETNDFLELARIAGLDIATDFAGAELRFTYLISADLRGVNLRGADLRAANLRVADLRAADLRGADLRIADLTGADLRIADLTGADLNGTNLTETKLNTAKVESARFGNNAGLTEDAKYELKKRGAIFPQDELIPALV